MKVGVFYQIAGKGHYIPAKNICESLNAMGHEAVMFDIFSFYPDGNTSGDFSESGWRFLQQHIGLENFYSSAADNRAFGKIQIDLGFRGCLDKFAEWYESFQPDVIGGTAWLSTRAVEFFKRALKLKCKIFHYSPDIVWSHINSVSDGYDKYFVVTDEGIEWAKSIGQDPATIEKCAFPLQSQIMNSPRLAKEEARKKLGIDDKFTLQLSMGGEGVLSMALLESLAQSKLDLQILCLGKLTDKTAATYDAFRKKYPEITVITPGFVNNVQDYTYAADLVLSKTGANTWMETVYMRRAYMMTDAFYVGKGIAAYIRRNSIGWYCPTIEEQTEQIKTLCRNPKVLEGVILNEGNLGIDFGADDIAKKIIKMVETE